MLQQSLQSQIGFAEEEVSKLKAALAQAQSSKTSDQKDLQEAESNLEADKKELDDLIVECRRKKEDYKIEKKDLAEELEALGKAKEALAEKTGESYSFLQVGTSSHAGTARPDENIATMLRDVAQRTNSTGLSLLSRRIRSLIRSDLTSGADAFEKIKTMISDMISSMEEQIRKAADKKAYCDSELAKAKTKLEGKQDEVEDLQTKMDGAASKSATLKAEASELRKALAVLAETEANATALREKESAQFEKTVPEVQEGLEGVKTALKVLREYYQGTKAASNRGGTATGVVGMLEVVESDFAKNLAQLRVAEATAKEDFKKGMQDLKLEKTRKEQDVKYKTQAAQRLDADLTELQSDSESVHTELSAIEEFNNGLKAECSVTPESFQEKQAKRKEEIDGLKTALEALDSQSGASFMQSQKKAVLRWLRGSRRADLSHD
ncbi:unnamed protein product [Effrenium voratum]|nr:unnamed protein product [Effrenium voratum]